MRQFFWVSTTYGLVEVIIAYFEIFLHTMRSYKDKSNGVPSKKPLYIHNVAFQKYYFSTLPPYNGKVMSLSSV